MNDAEYYKNIEQYYIRGKIIAICEAPVDVERKNWEAEALKRKDVEIAEAEALYKDHVTEACRKLIERFVIWNNLKV